MSKSRFLELVNAPKGSKFVLQGNEAFALGVVHAGYHAADGYPGTPSTEVIDKNLKYVQDKMKVGWSVNEATATAVAIGHSVAGFDSVVTMKIPGVFQAGDTITTSAFYNAPAGAFVIYAAADYVPSSTQHVIDARYFFASARIPVFEPRNHQEMYDIAWIAADISRKFKTQSGEQKDEVMFIDITFFGRTAEVANQYLKRGSKVLVDGRLKFDQWVAQDGTKRN
jgi:indolepyruvate ferredoxin oxidoreductase alpha subunit